MECGTLKCFTVRLPQSQFVYSCFSFFMAKSSKTNWRCCYGKLRLKFPLNPALHIAFVTNWALIFAILFRPTHSLYFARLLQSFSKYFYLSSLVYLLTQCLLSIWQFLPISMKSIFHQIHLIVY